MTDLSENAEAIKKYLTKDPGVPRPNPTASYWQHVPHALANVRSESLPQRTDIVVIGSGITGASVTKTLLEKDPSLKIIVLEARALCSGATGRNGGQLATNAGEMYAEYKERFGVSAAGEVAAFTFKTCERMREIVAAYAPEESEYRDVTKVRTFFDEESFNSMKSSITQMEEDHPNLRGIYKIIDSETVREKHGVHNSFGGITLPAGVMWPYRLVTKVFEVLLNQYKDRLTLETNTPVTSVGYANGSHVVGTSRGAVEARQVIHCTNGYASHLVPELRGLLFPVRGTMTVQDLGPNVPNNGAKDSFGFHYQPIYDKDTDTVADGLWYLTQNARTGYFFIGGEKANLKDSLTADDTEVSFHGVKALQEVLPKFFNYESVNPNPLISAWSGIMGFTADGAPYVGSLPSSRGGRPSNAEWIVAGFNGYGMPYCWLAGEALGNIVTGQSASDFLPEPFLMKESRLSPKETCQAAEMLASML